MLNKASSIHSIAEDNRIKCNIPQVLDALEITISTIPNINLYIFELIQNAIDVGADKLNFKFGQSSVTFEHNGQSLGDSSSHVYGLSNLFQSSKSLESIGFMGFGFKTIYKRFTTVSIKDISGWKFKFDVKETKYNLNDDLFIVGRDWLGAMTPIWNEDDCSIVSEGFSTRFHLEGITSDTLNIPLYDDFNTIDLTLPVLALKNVKEIKRNNGDVETTIKLFISSTQSIYKITAISSNKKMNWIAIEKKYKPSPLAIKHLFQSRFKNLINSDIRQLFSSFQSRTFSTIGIIEVDDDLIPLISEKKGNLFATLPLGIQLPFSMNIQADWLLDLSRKGLREISSNQWQQEIFFNIAYLIGDYLIYIVNHYNNNIEALSKAFQILDMEGISNSIFQNDLNFNSKEWITHFKSILNDIEFIPVIGDENQLLFKKSYEVYLLPEEKQNEYPPIYSSLIFGRYIIDRKKLPNGLLKFLVKSEVISELQMQVLESDWKSQGLNRWWNKISIHKTEKEKLDILLHLWSYISNLFNSKTGSLCCVITNDSKWISPSQLVVLEDRKTFKLHDVPLESEPYGSSAYASLSRFLPTSRLPQGWTSRLIEASSEWKTKNRTAYDWISSYWKKVPIIDYITEATNNGTPKQVLDIFAWVIVARKSSHLITHVISHPRDSQSNSIITPFQSTLIGMPYIDEKSSKAFQIVYSDAPVLSEQYNTLYTEFKKEGFSISEILLNQDILGPVKIIPTVKETINVIPDYKIAKERVAQILEVSYDELKDIQTTRQHNWKIWDQCFPVVVNENMNQSILVWLSSCLENLQNAKSYLYVEGYDRRPFISCGRNGSAKWIKDLSTLNWIKIGENWFSPSNLTKDTLQQYIPLNLYTILIEKGLGHKNS